MSWRENIVQVRVGDLVDVRKGNCSCDFCGSGPFTVVGQHSYSVSVVNSENVHAFLSYSSLIVTQKTQAGDGMW